VAGYTRTVRPPESYTEPLKLQQIASLRLPGRASDYEEDHFIPLEVGGHPRDPRNLWPEGYAPSPGAREKDRVETFLHDQICAGKMPLQQAQEAVQTDWYAVYLQIVGPAGAIVSASGSLTASSPALVPTAVSPATGSEASGHAFYASGAANASNIYCDTDPEWKRLSPANLQKFTTLEAAQAAHPTYKLHQSC